GRLGIAWVLVDEVCGGTDDPAYLDYFRAPMFRDGARVGDLMYVVDATHLWVLDVSDPEGINRHRLLGGLGEPLALALHGGDLLIAAGSAGLLRLDLSEPLHPVIADQVVLPGPALDVHVEADQAFVTTGKAGLAVVALNEGPMVLGKTIATPGFAAGVTARDGLAYVAACDAFAVIDVASETVLSQTWLAGAYDGDILVAPAKDVELVGDVAFVAAGRFGAVAVDVTTPTTPSLLGNCTVQDDMQFYASGVRANGARLFVAGGEWGILPLDVQQPTFTCAAHVLPVLPELPEEGGECEQDAPWEVVPWDDIFEPVPPGKDPIQTLPYGELVYAFGDARRIGLRAVDVRLAGAPDLDKVGRYHEPRLVTGVAAAQGRVLAIGQAGGLYWRDEQSLLVPDPVPIVAAQDGAAVAMLADGRWVIGTHDQLLVVEDGAAPLPLSEPIGSQGLAVSGTRAVVPTSYGAMLLDVDGAGTEVVHSGAETELPQAVAVANDEVYLAAPEWTEAIKAGAGDGTPLPPHGVFDVDDVMDATLWRVGLPRRLLVDTTAGLAEIATLGGKAGLALHGTEEKSTLLPTGTYVDAIAQGGKLYLVTVDRGSYRSQLVTVDLASSPPAVTAVEGFTGIASGVAVDLDRLYVGDADQGIRVYDSSGADPVWLGTVALEVSP
ncbi:MAG: hypothetical protein JRI68_05195, partial [Deltaproteobacteria bacterium]|nr:hypothetical protein [Deltaproteobacteria bacterium]